MHHIVRIAGCLADYLDNNRCYNNACCWWMYHGGCENCHKIFWHMPKIIRVDSVVGYSMTTSNNWCIRLVYLMHYVSENPTATKEDESICMSHCGW